MRCTLYLKSLSTHLLCTRLKIKVSMSLVVWRLTGENKSFSFSWLSTVCVVGSCDVCFNQKYFKNSLIDDFVYLWFFKLLSSRLISLGGFDYLITWNNIFLAVLDEN